MAAVRVPEDPLVFGNLNTALTTRVIADAACFAACTVFFLGTLVTACRRGKSFVTNTARRLTLFLIASLWIMALSDASNFFPRMAEGTSCKVLGMIRQFCTCNVALWTWVVSYYLYDTIMTQRSSTVSELKIHVGVLAGSLLATALPLIGDTYGYAGSWCWIRPDVSLGIFFQFATYYVPLWVIIASVCLMYTRVGMRVYKVKQQTARYLPKPGSPPPPAPPLQGGFGPTPTMNSRPSSRTPSSRRPARTPRALFRYTLKKLGPFPVIFVICWVFPTARRVYQDAVGRPPEWLVVAQAVSTPLQGVLFVLFFYRRPIRHMCSCLCRCCCRSDARSSRSHRSSMSSSAHQYTQKSDGSFEHMNALHAANGQAAGGRSSARHSSVGKDVSNGALREKSQLSQVALSPPSRRNASGSGGGMRSASGGGMRSASGGPRLLSSVAVHGIGLGADADADPPRAHAGSAPSDMGGALTQAAIAV